MKLRLEESSIGFKISTKELDTLLTLQSLSAQIMGLTYQIRLDETVLQTTLTYAQHQFTLTLHPQTLTDHKTTLPNKQGLVSTIDGPCGDVIKAILQVDIKSPKH